MLSMLINYYQLLECYTISKAKSSSNFKKGTASFFTLVGIEIFFLMTWLFLTLMVKNKQKSEDGSNSYAYFYRDPCCNSTIIFLAQWKKNQQTT